jgi:hypothetical protein
VFLQHASVYWLNRRNALSVCPSRLGAGTTVDLLELDSGAAAVARANIVDAVASDSLSASEVDSFVAEIEGALLSTRQQWLNDVAFSANDSETVDAVTTNASESSETSRSMQFSVEPSSISAVSMSVVYLQTAVAPAKGNRAIADARSTG